MGADLLIPQILRIAPILHLFNIKNGLNLKKYAIKVVKAQIKLRNRHSDA